MTCSLIKKSTLPQVLSCELYEIFMKTFFIERLRWLLLGHGENNHHLGFSGNCWGVMK